MFEISKTEIAGLMRLDPVVRSDTRGRFVKTFHADFFTAHGLRTDFAESYYSLSRKGVLRGMHFQTPPAQHAKLVHCAAGRILDVVVDLRRSEPSYGQFVSFELNADKGTLLYIPEGCAHGFLALSEDAMTVYNVTSVYTPAEDSGILWSSFGFEWPVREPLLSDRDLGFLPLSRFDSPF
ncbi:dTDP-4-dehydrorhamnose 3,5-epimerase [Allorhizobium borbori]|uniref:dTDP-4-dehydrorhamnose 3,5-epimerase n=1 Tax=Allorhizobium borbori TaxID=485907 RepID=A0A7W6K5W7_9HYPH|nr:dTDP-4-dehydrorhamnose 3,5-epimerase [Allorhizobium borbori]MBB4104582.1 dTDP-4-dehydrorhamnose 3,5-epimerase [Allorhizobium borbori]